MTRADTAEDFIQWDDEKVVLRIGGSDDRFCWDALQRVVAAGPPPVLLLHLDDQSFALSSSVARFEEFCHKLFELQGFDRDAFRGVLAAVDKTRSICWERPALADALLRTPPPYTELVQAVFAEDPVSVERLLISGGDANERWAGCPVLMLAIEDNDTDHVVKVLLNHGANVNLADSNHNTPLHDAVIGAIECAMDSGAAIDLSVVRLLLRHGADPNVRNARDESPIEIPQHYGRSFLRQFTDVFSELGHLGQ